MYYVTPETPMMSSIIADCPDLAPHILDKSTSVFLNTDVTQINRLQAIQNALVRAITKTLKHHHITPVPQTLHWLKIHEQIEYKLISLKYNTLQSS